MQTIYVTNPATAYTDYCLLYRQHNGTMERALTLLRFCNRIKQGKVIKVGEVRFLPQ